MSTATPNSEAAIFGRLIQVEQNDLSPELARHILNIGFASADRDRMNELAAKARAGTLTPEDARWRTTISSAIYWHSGIPRLGGTCVKLE